MSDNNDLSAFFRGVLKACDKVCGYKKNRDCDVNTWWWNSAAKDEIQKKKVAYKEMKKNPIEETQNEYKRLKKAAKKAVARAMKEEAVRKIIEIRRNHNNVFRLVRKMTMASTDVAGGRCTQGKMMEHFILMRWIEQNSGKHRCDFFGLN